MIVEKSPFGMKSASVSALSHRLPPGPCIHSCSRPVGGEGKQKGRFPGLLPTRSLSPMAGGQEGQRCGAGSTLGGSEPLCWDRGNGQGALSSEPGVGALPAPLCCWQQRRPTSRTANRSKSLGMRSLVEETTVAK